MGQSCWPSKIRIITIVGYRTHPLKIKQASLNNTPEVPGISLDKTVEELPWKCKEKKSIHYQEQYLSLWHVIPALTETN